MAELLASVAEHFGAELISTQKVFLLVLKFYLFYQQQYGVVGLCMGFAGPRFGSGTTGKLGHAWHRCMGARHGAWHFGLALFNCPSVRLSVCLSIVGCHCKVPPNSNPVIEKYQNPFHVAATP